MDDTADRATGGEAGSAQVRNQLAHDLQALRQRAGLSYADIVRRIAESRRAAGVPDGGIRPARTTVYDAFRPDRSRLDPALVGEIAAALGATPEQVEDFRRRCRVSEPAGPDALPTSPPPQQQPPPEPRPGPDLPAIALRSVMPGRWWLVAAVCCAINLLGNLLAEYLDLPLYLDMIGTALAAAIGGPWFGSAVATVAGLLGVLIHGPIALPFTAVSVVGALVWGYGLRSNVFRSTLPRFFTLNLLAALACSATAVPILLGFLSGSTGHPSDSVVARLEVIGEPGWLAVAHGNLMTSIADKLLAGFVVLVTARAVARLLVAPAATRASGPLALVISWVRKAS